MNRHRTHSSRRHRARGIPRRRTLRRRRPHKARSARAAPPRPGHIFILILENESFARTFAQQSLAPYLAHELPTKGALLRNYYGIGHNSLDNYIALVSGQAPNESTQRDCTKFAEFELAEPTLDENGQAIGRGCVYPTIVPMLGDQLEARGRAGAATCRISGTTNRKRWRSAAIRRSAREIRRSIARPPISTRPSTIPFYYFHSLIDNHDRCVQHVVNLNKSVGRSEIGRDDAELFVHHSQPVRRWPRCAVRRQGAGRARAGRRIPAEVGAEDHGLAGVQERRRPDHHLR